MPRKSQTAAEEPAEEAPEMAPEAEAYDPEGPARVNAIDMVGTAAPAKEPEHERFAVRPVSRGTDRLPAFEVFDLVDEKRADGLFEYEEDAIARAELLAVHKAREVS